jgi:hypothetical protein
MRKSSLDVERKQRSGRRFQLTWIISQYAWAVSGSGLLQSNSQVETGAALPWESGVGRWDDKRLGRSDRLLGLGTRCSNRRAQKRLRV